MEKLVAEYQNATGRQRERLFRQIHDSMVGLVKTIADRPGNSKDDLTQEGLLALHEAALAFDPSLGVPFYNYARQRVRWAISKAQRTNTRNHDREVYSPQSLDGDVVTVPSQLDALVLAEALERFTGRDREVAEMLAAGFSGVDIAERFGISKQRASQIIARIRKEV
jgi:RNA polymerase sigma factor (sigma-70 family)